MQTKYLKDKMMSLRFSLFLLILLTNCKKAELPVDLPSLPNVTTFKASTISKSIVIIGGKVESENTAEITDRGVSWSKSQFAESHELVSNRVSAGPGSGSFTATITGLKPNTDYFFYAYATNISGTKYGNPLLATTEFDPDPNLPVDPNYPTTFYKLHPDTLSKRITAFTERNMCIVSSLNEFGFCLGGGSFIHPPHCDNITQEEALSIVKNFISQNKVETGIRDTNDLVLIESQNTKMSNNDFRWFLKFSLQKIGSSEVITTTITTNIINSEVIQFSGNWYPHIYIPGNFNLDPLKAKELLNDRILSFPDFACNPYYLKIPSQDLNSAIVKLAIVPLIRGDNIQLSVTWEIFVLHHLLYVDIMTGEIVLDICMLLS